MEVTPLLIGLLKPAEAVFGLDSRPEPEMDRFLDATARCIARYGIGRVSMQDVAREAGVDRTTVYRQVGPIKQQIRLLAARDIARALEAVPTGEDGPVGVDDVVNAMVTIVEVANAHPVVNRILHDDSDQVTLGDIHHVQRLFASLAEALAPWVALAMEQGWLAHRDPRVTASWLVSSVVWLVLMPPEGVDARSVLAEIVGPVLQPPDDPSRTAI